MGISQAESVAAHSWGVSWLVMRFAPTEIDANRALKIAMVHDLPEVRTGDITPFDGIGPAEKHRLEASAAKAIFDGQPELLSLWEEYALNESPEANFVHACDKLDMALQAIHYAAELGVNTAEFIASARAAIDDPRLIKVIDDAEQR